MGTGKKLWTGPEKVEGGMTHFGFRRVPAAEKASLVSDHFDVVAKKYDLMNTLLSFGIHYLWKRTAIELLELSKVMLFWTSAVARATSPYWLQSGPVLPGGLFCMI